MGYRALVKEVVVNKAPLSVIENRYPLPAYVSLSMSHVVREKYM